MEKILYEIAPNTTVCSIWYGKLRIGIVDKIYTKTQIRHPYEVSIFCDMIEYPNLWKETFWHEFIFNEVSIITGSPKYELRRIADAIDRIRKNS